MLGWSSRDRADGRTGAAGRAHCGPSLQQLARQRRDLPVPPRPAGGVPVARGDDGPVSVGDVVNMPGTPLDTATRARMQARLGHDFATVRVHSDERAEASTRAVRARAYTVGEHVVLDRAQLPAGSAARDELIAHELVHTLQQGPLGGRSIPSTTSRADSPAEREAAHAAAAPATAATLAAPAVHREPPADRGPGPDVGLNLTIRSDGQLDAVATGPQAPVIGKPAFGIRRRADGTFTVLFGAGEKVVAPAEIPPILRSMVKATESGKPGAQSFRIPTCAALRTHDGTRWHTYDEYRVTQMLTPDLLPLSKTFYDQLTGECTVTAARPEPDHGVTDAPAPEPPHEALPPVLPAGQAAA